MRRWLACGCAVFISWATAGCAGEPPAAAVSPERREAPTSAPAPAADPAPAEPPAPVKRVPVGKSKNVWVEIDPANDRRRTLVSAWVCLRQGPLEHLMCRQNTKEHEAILSADVDARDIHAALLLCRAKPGSPVKYEPKFQAPSGTKIRVTLQYPDKGKIVTVPARQWVRDANSGKELQYDWVFAGSVLIPNPDGKDRPPLFLANGGDVICVSNFPGALLDLPVNSPKDNSELEFEAFTERIPPLETKVTVILEPVSDGPKK